MSARMNMTPATSTARVWLACQARCGGEGHRFDLIQPAVRCPDCGGLLDPVVDLDAISADATSLRDRLSARRTRPADARDRSGVWRFRDLFWPGDLAPSETVTLGEGNAGVVELPWTLPDGTGGSSSSMPGLSVIRCGENPTGSFKDLGMTVLGTWGRAIARRRASQGKGPPTLLCASTGDTSAALAAYGARAGLPVVVLLPTDKISPAQLVQPLAHGACVIAIDGDFDTCMGVVAGIADRAADTVDDVDALLLANSKNPIRLLGQLTVALEIAEAAWLGGRLPDVVCVPSGNLGNISALHLGFSIARAAGLIDRLPRLVACQVDAANPLYRLVTSSSGSPPSSMVAGETHASAIRIGAPVSLPRALKALTATNGTVTSVSEEALLSASARADRLGLFVCPQTAAALAGVEQLVARGEVGAADHVAVVATAAGLKFVEQKTAFHAGSTALGPMALSPTTAALRNAPRVVAANVDAVMAVIATIGGR
jgi:threonine synthase